MQKKTKTILVTKEESAFPQLKSWCSERGLHLIAKPFISIEPILGLTIPTTNWIFFSSPKGANAYLKHYTVQANKIGAYGEATKQVLEKHDLTVDFTGKNEDDPEQIGLSFKAIISNNETVLFPISQRSKKSISKALEPKQTRSLISYHTVLNPSSANPSPDIILFTSPSNFESYLSCNEITNSTVIIAMGITTEAAIRSEFNERKIYTLNSPNQESLIEILFTL